MNLNDEIALARQLTAQLKVNLVNLYSRWLDEREYEDFQQYVGVLRTWAEGTPGVTFLKAHKRPWGFSFQVGSSTFRIALTNTRLQLIKLPGGSK